MRRPQKSNGARSQMAAAISIPAPTGGWDQKSPLSAMPINKAVVLDNWIPRAGYCEARAGSAPQVNGMASPVHSLMVWRGPTTDKIFAGSGVNVFDASTQGAAPGAPVYTAGSSSAWQAINVQNSAGQFLWAVNGSDTPIYYNGTAWTANAGLSGSSGAITLTPSDLIGCFVNSNRVWGIEKNSLRAWFLPVQAITGAMQLLDMGTVFQLGGSLKAGATWTVEGGVGPSSYAIFITTKGEIAVWQGTDPTNADNWSLVGVYTTGEPIGYRCLLRMGSDVMVITTLGVLPLSQIMMLDRAAQEDVALTDGIKNAFRTAQKAYSANFGWEAISYPAGAVTVFNIPTTPYSAAVQYVQEDQTGGWCRWVGMNATCWALANGLLYFGASDGVYQADTGATDNGLAITYDLQGAFSAHGLPGRNKQWTMMRPLLRTSPRIQPAMNMLADYASRVPINIPTVPAQAGTIWGQMIWGSTIWSNPNAIRYDWTGCGAIGFVGSPRMTFSISAPAGSLVADGAGNTLADGNGNEIAVSVANFAVPVQLLGIDVILKPASIP